MSRRFILLVVVHSIGLLPTHSIAANEAPASKNQAANLFNGKCEVTALFLVSSNPPSLLSDDRRETDWRLLSNTQIAYFKSHFLLQSALRNDGIQNLPLIRSQPDPVAWLRSQLDVGFYDNSEIMYVVMRGDTADREQLRAIVNAVGEAYLKEVVFEEEQRQLVIRDALQRSLSSLSEEIREKLETQNALAEDLGVSHQYGGSRVMQDLDLKRLDRIETELLRLENEQLAAKVLADQEEGETTAQERAKLTFYEKRIEQLRKRQVELEERIAIRSQKSVALTISAAELEQLQEIAREMSLKLEHLDLEAVQPDRIRLIQNAN